MATTGIEFELKNMDEKEAEMEVMEQQKSDPDSQNTFSFLDLGWGLHSIKLIHPFERKYNATIYSGLSASFALFIAVIPNYMAVLTISILNVILQLTVLGYGIYKYYSKEANIAEKGLSMNIKEDNTDSYYVENNPMSPLMRIYQQYDNKFKDSDIVRSKSSFCRTNNLFVKMHNFFSSFDALFDSKIQLVRPYYFRFVSILYGVILSIYTLCIIAKYQNSPLNICPISYGFDFVYGFYHEDWVKPNAGVHVRSNNSCSYTILIFDEAVYPWFVCFGTNLLTSYEVKEIYLRRMNIIIQKLRETFKKEQIENIQSRVDRYIFTEIESKFTLSGQIKSYIVMFLIWSIGMVYWRSTVGTGGFNIVTVLIPIVSASIYANDCVALLKVCILSKYLLIISRIFSEPIYCDHRASILSWWQLRHFYNTYYLPVHINILTPVMYYGFIFIVICPFWAVMALIQDRKSGQDFWFYPIQFGIAILFSSVILYCMKQFVSGYNEQCRHVGMLQKELVRIDCTDDRFEKSEVEKMKSTVKLITDHMHRYDEPIKISGIPMTNTIFVLLRGAMSGIALLIIAEIIAN